MKRKLDWKHITWLILVVSLGASLVFTLVKLIQAPASSGDAGQRQKSDYLLMLIQCALGLLVVFLPSFLEKRFRIDIPNSITVLYFVFLYCAIYLGEVRSFYYRVPHWDTYLHTFSGGMLGALGFALVTILNGNEKLQFRLSPVFLGLFAFSFAVALGAVWEIYEYAMDGLLDLNMQKFRLETGEELIGRAALMDTMKDLIVDALGALVVVVIGVLGIKRQAAQAQKPDASAASR